MFYSNGRLYYTPARPGRRCYWRYFSPDDGVVGATSSPPAATSTSATSPACSCPADTLYYADKATGDLHGGRVERRRAGRDDRHVVSGPARRQRLASPRPVRAPGGRADRGVHRDLHRPRPARSTPAPRRRRAARSRRTPGTSVTGTPAPACRSATRTPAPPPTRSPDRHVVARWLGVEQPAGHGDGCAAASAAGRWHLLRRHRERQRQRLVAARRHAEHRTEPATGFSWPSRWRTSRRSRHRPAGRSSPRRRVRRPRS